MDPSSPIPTACQADAAACGVAQAVGLTDDARWLMSDAARPALALAATLDLPLPSSVQRLRKELSPERCRLVVELSLLRRRAVGKFSLAERMFFTRQLLEQATDERIARYKSARVPPNATVVDLCCGIGGDLAALAQGRTAIGVDRDPLAAAFARRNGRELGCPDVTTLVQTAESLSLPAGAWWHLDPDRRAHGRRSVRVEEYSPGVDFLRQLLATNAGGAVKLAPAATLPAELARAAHCEWIGSARECLQQVAWFGELIPTRSASDTQPQAGAAIVRGDGPAERFVGKPDVAAPLVDAPRRYVLEPHPTVLAAHLTGSLAESWNLARFTARDGYLTGDQAIETPWFALFEVQAVLPFDRGRLRKLLQSRGLSALEIKHRGADLDPEQLRRDLRIGGGVEATLLIAGRPQGHLAILARRLHTQSGTRANE